MILKNLTVERIKTNEEKGDNISMSFVASTSGVDRFGDVIDQNGWDISSYEKNSVVLFNHDPTQLPIGKGAVALVDGNLMIDIDFDMNDPRAAEIGRKTKEGFLNAVSVGFNPIEATKRSDLPEDHYAKGANGTFFSRAELLEVSVVTIPANSEAVASKQYQGNVLKVIAKHILDIIKEEDRIIVSYARAPEEENEVIEEEEEDLDEEYEEEGYDLNSEEEEEEYRKSIIGDLPNQPATKEEEEIQSLSYLIGLMNNLDK